MFDKLKELKKDECGYNKHATKRFIDSLDDDLDKENCADKEEEQIFKYIRTTSDMLEQTLQIS